MDKRGANGRAFQGRGGAWRGGLGRGHASCPSLRPTPPGRATAARGTQIPPPTGQSVAAGPQHSGPELAEV